MTRTNQDKLQEIIEGAKKETLHDRLAQLAQDAIFVQDARNISGVIHALDRTMSKIADISRANCTGTDWLNKHPIIVLFADKLASMAGVQGISSESQTAYGRAYDACRDMAGIDEKGETLCPACQSSYSTIGSEGVRQSKCVMCGNVFDPHTKEDVDAEHQTA